MHSSKNERGGKKASIIAACLVAFVPALFAFAQIMPAPAMSTATTTEMVMPAPEADTTSPEILSITDMSAEPTTLVIAWTTDELTYGRVEYGPTLAYGSSTSQSAVASMEHAQMLSGLAPGTTYYYRIVATDAAGNVTYSENRTATTAAEPEPMDNAPPEITEVTVSEVTTSSATFSITTDEPARVEIEYGTTENYGAVRYSGDEFATMNEIALAGLAANTTYHYRVTAEDIAGNRSASFDNTFTTQEAPAQKPAPAATSTEPFRVLESAPSSVGTSTVTIEWTTNKAGTGTVGYGIGNTNSQAASSASAATSQSVRITGLAPGTNYSYRIAAQTSSGETATREDLEWNTLPVPAGAPEELIITNPAVQSVGTSTARVSWSTNLPSDGEVAYGTSTAYGASSGYAPALTTSHTHALSDLAPDTTYHFIIISADEAGNTAVSEDYNFKTAAVAPSTPNIVAATTTTTLATSTKTIDQIIADETAEIAEESASGVTVLPTPKENAPAPASKVIGVARAPTRLPQATLIKAVALDGQAAFLMQKPSAHHTTRVRIVRNAHHIPKHPKDGRIVYEGVSRAFTDINLVNGHTYYYAIYGVDTFRGFSAPVIVKVMPTAGKTQTYEEATPKIFPATPKFIFSNDMRKGNTGRDVKHLQSVLAQDATIYPKGLVTGYFGNYTKKAVMVFQKKYGIQPVSGFVGYKTRQKLQQLTGL